MYDIHTPHFGHLYIQNNEVRFNRYVDICFQLCLLALTEFGRMPIEIDLVFFSIRFVFPFNNNKNCIR